MALISCRNCGQRISDKAHNCPKCGFNMDQGENFCGNCGNKREFDTNHIETFYMNVEEFNLPLIKTTVNYN